MTRYQVFLAPPVPPHPSSILDLPLVFHDLTPPPRYLSESFSLPPPRRLAPDDPSQNKKKRISGLKAARGALARSESSLAPTPSTAPSTSIRRSSRLSKGADTTGQLLNVLPHALLDPSESILSLNTTISNPSQYPPSFAQTHLPTWSIPLTKLTTLASLFAQDPITSRSKSTRNRTRTHTTGTGAGAGDNDGGRRPVSLLVCVVSVDQPVLRRRQEEKRKGADGSLWIGNWVVISPAEGAAQEERTCPVKLWDEMARVWSDERVRRGDVVLLENVDFKPGTIANPAHLSISTTSSSTVKPKITVLYRTLPRFVSTKSDYIHREANDTDAKMISEDRAYRPDLRLARSDQGVRKVSEVARWFASWVGGQPPPN